MLHAAGRNPVSVWLSASTLLDCARRRYEMRHRHNLAIGDLDVALIAAAADAIYLAELREALPDRSGGR
jgi:hypothetical protein